MICFTKQLLSDILAILSFLIVRKQTPSFSPGRFFHPQTKSQEIFAIDLQTYLNFRWKRWAFSIVVVWTMGAWKRINENALVKTGPKWLNAGRVREGDRKRK